MSPKRENAVQCFFFLVSSTFCMSDFVAINGQITPYEAARIPPFDAGFLHGAGLFETMLAGNGRVFRLAEHLHRLHESARELGFAVQLDTAATAELVAELMETNGLFTARVRITLTPGDISAPVPDHHPDPDIQQDWDPPRTVLISAGPLAAYPPALYEKGMTVAVSSYYQNPHSPLCGHKTISYMDRLLGLRQAQKCGAGEALWFTAAESRQFSVLAEGCISNVFLVDGGGAIGTPPWQMPGQPGCRLALPGITRQTVLELAATHGLPVQEKVLNVQDVLTAKEIFLTNAIMGVMPVVRVERHAVGDEKPGPLTNQIRRIYEQKVQEQCHG